jgi:hypothetical protein
MTANDQTGVHGGTCPLCHTVAVTITDSVLTGGGDWTCAACNQRWDAERLAAVARYAEFVAERARHMPA